MTEKLLTGTLSLNTNKQINHFYCENNKGSLFLRCNENEAIVVVAINRQYLHTVLWFASKFI